MANRAVFGKKRVRFALPEEPVPVVVPPMSEEPAKQLEGERLTETIMELCMSYWRDDNKTQPKYSKFLKTFFDIHPHTMGRAISYKGTPKDMWSWGRKDITHYEYVGDFYVALSTIHNTNEFVLCIQRLFFSENIRAGGHPPIVNDVYKCC